jgi:hypothetical protein
LLIAALPPVMEAQLEQMTLIITTFNPFHLSDMLQEISQKDRFWRCRNDYPNLSWLGGIASRNCPKIVVRVSSNSFNYVHKKAPSTGLSLITTSLIQTTSDDLDVRSCYGAKINTNPVLRVVVIPVSRPIMFGKLWDNVIPVCYPVVLT